MLGQQLVYIVVIPIVQAGGESASPHGPLTIAHTPISKGRYPNTVRIQTVAEVEVLDFHRVRTSSNASNQVLVLAVGGKRRLILDPAKHVRYTVLDHGANTSVVRAGDLVWRRDHRPVFYVLELSHLRVAVSRVFG